MEADNHARGKHGARLGDTRPRQAGRLTGMRVAGIAITPPGTKASGGVSAGLQLMRRVADLVPTDMLVMSDRDSVETDGALMVHHRAAFSGLNMLSSLAPKALRTLAWRVDFGAWLDVVRPDVVHLHNPHPPGALASAGRACIDRQLPYLISTHGYVEYDDYATAYGGAAWQRPIIDRLVRRPLLQVTQSADRVLMLSPDERPIFDRMGIDPDYLDVVTNGVDPWFLEPVPDAEIETLLARFALPKDRPLIFYVGNHTRNKGIDVLLGAMARMTTTATAVIGGGIRSPEEHGTMLADAGYDPLSGRAVFTDFLSRDELKALYQRCDIFAFPSRADTLPLVILEAMASAKPVVATRIGGIPYEVTDNTGILIDSGDVEGLARALDRLVADAPLRAKMGRAGRARAVDLFNWERSAERAVTVYQQLLNARAVSRGI
jgi:alpha-maltose-1-phosphate synthase